LLDAVSQTEKLDKLKSEVKEGSNG
jgi:hypothetical protein